MDKITGLHHVTAISGNARKNFDFYTRVLGLRFVKKTVNFDDPLTYHFYYGDKQGTPGTILTFFPWEDIMTGRRGTHMVTEVGYAIPEGSIDFWIKRFEKENLLYKCGWSPLEGTIFPAAIEQTFVNGNCVYGNSIWNESIKGERMIFER